MITDRQTRLLRQKRMEGKTQETAAAKAGMSVRSARKWQSGPLPSQAKPEHRWRTRPDPFDGVWEDEIEPLLRNDPTGKLKATTIIDCPSTSSGGRAASRAVQRVPAADAATTIAGLAGAAWSGSGGVLPPGASAGTGGPVRLHPLRGTQGDHRRTVLPPPAVPADTQPLGMALRRGRRRRDLPGPCSRDCRMPSGPWAAFQRWCAATIPRLPPTNCAAAAAALLTTITPPCWTTMASAPPASIPARAMKTASPSTPTTASRTPSTRPSSCGAAVISTPPTTTPASSGRWWRDAIAW